MYNIWGLDLVYIFLWLSNSSSTVCWKGSSSTEISKISWAYLCKSVSGLSTLFYQSMICSSTNTTLSLYCSCILQILTLGRLILPILFLFYKTVLAIVGPLPFNTNFRKACLCLQNTPAGHTPFYTISKIILWENHAWCTHHPGAFPTAGQSLPVYAKYTFKKHLSKNSLKTQGIFREPVKM